MADCGEEDCGEDPSRRSCEYWIVGRGEYGGSQASSLPHFVGQ